MIVLLLLIIVYIFALVMNGKNLKNCCFKNVTAFGRMAIACFFVLTIVGTEIVKTNELVKHFSIENVDFTDKGESEKEGKKDTKLEQAEVDDFVYFLGYDSSRFDNFTSHNFYYRKLPSGSYLDVLQQPPKA